jgi:hypothetical protein
MPYLQRLSTMPSEESLTDKDREWLQKHFDIHPQELWINGDAVRWDYIEEIEVVVAARAKGPAGWLVRNVVMGGERYHLAAYYGYNESVLTNMNENIARYVLNMIAYYAPVRLKYTGPDSLAALTEY